MAETNSDVQTEAVSPSGINHLVLNVRDIDEAHRRLVIKYHIAGWIPLGIRAIDNPCAPSQSVNDSFG